MVAARSWPTTGVPPNPGGWLTTTARRRALDRLRREAVRGEREAEATPSGSATCSSGWCPTSPRRRGCWRSCCSSPLADRPGWRRTAPWSRSAEQDRGLWNDRLTAEGRALLRGCLRQRRPGPYQLHAAVNAVHSEAATMAETDWAQILLLHDQLLAIAPTPVL